MRPVRVILAAVLVLSVFLTAVSGCGSLPPESSVTESEATTRESVPETETQTLATEEPSSETEEETLPPEPEYELSLSDTYRPNGIGFSTFEVGVGDLYVHCPSVSGLKDETVNRRINVGLFQHVTEEAEALLQYYPDGIVTLSSNSVLDASFSNVISVRTTFVVEEAPGSEDVSRPLVVEFSDNYELLTGHPVSFQDLFREDVTAEDLFGAEGEAFQKAIVKSLRTLEPMGTALSEHADPKAEFDSIKAAFDGGEKIPFRFDEKEATVIVQKDTVLYELSVPYLDFMKETVIYAKYLSEDAIYEEEPEGAYPVLFKRFPCSYAVFENSDRALIDAVLYAPETSDGGILRFITEDAKDRLDGRVREALDAEGGLVIYNAELSLYEMKNGFMNGRSAPVYVSVREYVIRPSSEEAYESLRSRFVDDLQKRTEEEAILKKTLFLDESVSGVESRFVAWYYDEAGNFIAESVLDTAK